jgi:hypothetical protein
VRLSLSCTKLLYTVTERYTVSSDHMHSATSLPLHFHTHIWPYHIFPIVVADVVWSIKHDQSCSRSIASKKHHSEGSAISILGTGALSQIEGISIVFDISERSSCSCCKASSTFLGSSASLLTMLDFLLPMRPAQTFSHYVGVNAWSSLVILSSVGNNQMKRAKT